MAEQGKMSAEVISVFPNKIKISVDNLDNFQGDTEKLKVGSYLRISDNDNSVLIAIIENFTIEVSTPSVGIESQRKYILEANPLGLIRDGKFERGGDTITIPPKSVEPAKKEEVEKIFVESLEDKKKFVFSRLSTNLEIIVPVDGDKFFNKHIAIIGSTGSGKSHTVAKIIQNAVNAKDGNYEGLNNSHVVIFDIHSEYRTAFPKANLVDISNLKLPYWLLNSEELEELFLESGDHNNYNQASLLRRIVTENKKAMNPSVENVFFDSPILFDVDQILNCLINLSKETKNYKNSDEITIKGAYFTPENDSKKFEHYFKAIYEFEEPKSQNFSKGAYADGTIDKFISRLENKIHDKRLKFLFDAIGKSHSFESVLKKLMGYENEKLNNVTLIDLSGIPFDVLSITVSLISRILFEYGYFYKRLREKDKKDEKINNDVPLLLVYEEAHKYVPKSDLAKYKASKESIERIAKEGRKYGVSLLLASQRPSEISETIFSQCNNFIALRLTNPNDQDYVKRLLPDTLGNLIDKMPSLRAGEALLIGDAVVLPSIVQIDRCNPEPSSSDIPYYELWKQKWKDLDINAIKDIWLRY
jgi:DNA helicase HerA-like ATPase